MVVWPDGITNGLVNVIDGSVELNVIDAPPTGAGSGIVTVRVVGFVDPPMTDVTLVARATAGMTTKSRRTDELSRLAVNFIPTAVVITPGVTVSVPTLLLAATVIVCGLAMTAELFEVSCTVTGVAATELRVTETVVGNPETIVDGLSPMNVTWNGLTVMELTATVLA